MLSLLRTTPNHVQPEGGSAAERFFRRGVKSKLPNRIITQLDQNALIRQRHEKQIRIAQQKGRTSKDQFNLQDRVIVQDMTSKRWILKGEVTSVRYADDGSIQSYEISSDDGTKYIPNKRYIKHDRNMNAIRKVVRFQLADEAEQAGPPLRKSRAT